MAEKNTPKTPSKSARDNREAPANAPDQLNSSTPSRPDDRATGEPASALTPLANGGSLEEPAPKPTPKADDQQASPLAGRVENEALEVDVPDCGPDPRDADKARWVNATLDVFAVKEAFEGRTRKAAYQALSMAFLSALLHSPEYFRQQLQAADMAIPGSKSDFAFAVAYFYGLDVGHVDIHTARNNSKTLNRYCEAMRGLRERAPTQYGLVGNPSALSYNEAGVRTLMDIIEKAGGINKLASQSDTTGRGDEGPQIALDKTALRNRRERLAKAEALTKGASENTSVGIALAYHKGGETAVARFLNLPDDLHDQVLAQMVSGDHRVEALGEQFQFALAVKELPTDVLVNRDDDPSSARSPRRLASRQHVLHPDGRISISPILADASVVILIEPSEPLLAISIKGHANFHTGGRKKAEANILQPERRPAFDLEYGSTEGTQGVARVVLRTSLATKQEDNDRDVGFLVEKQRGSVPLTVDEELFNPKAEAVASVPGWRSFIAEYGPKLSKLGKSGDMIVNIRLEGQRVRFSDDRSSDDLVTSECTNSTEVAVRADDLLSTFRAVAEIPFTGPIVLAVDPNGIVRFGFETMRGRYGLFMPTALRDGSRSTRHMTPLKVQDWPDGAAE